MVKSDDEKAVEAQMIIIVLIHFWRSKTAQNKKENTVVPGCNVNGYNGHPHITDKILWSQIFSGFYNVNFPLYNGL